MSKYFIVRNRNNSLRAFQNKPAKTRWGFWESIDGYLIKLRDTWFPKVKWEDKEPKVLTIDESPWIKVEDRLPNVGEIVLCLCKMRGRDYRFHLISSFDGNKEWNYLYSDIFDIIAWMPIPEFKE